MSNASRFSAGISRLEAVGGKAPKPVAPAPVVPQAAESPSETHQAAQEKGKQQPSRVGKVNISGYFDPAVRKQINLLAAELDQNKAELLAEAINLLFEKHGRSPIARA